VHTAENFVLQKQPLEIYAQDSINDDDDINNNNNNNNANFI
jgi:hypothetical protein